MSNVLSHDLSWTAARCRGGNFVLEWKKGPFFWGHLGLIVVNFCQVTVLLSVQFFQKHWMKDNLMTLIAMWGGRDVHEIHGSPPHPDPSKQIDVLKKAEEKGAQRGLDGWKEADWRGVRPVKYGADLSICSSPLCLLVCKIYDGGGGGKKECSTCPCVCLQRSWVGAWHHCVALCIGLIGEGIWSRGLEESPETSPMLPD